MNPCPESDRVLLAHRREVTAIDVPTPFATFDDYWQPFLGGQGPASAYAMSLDETAGARLRERLRERLPLAADGSLALTARAWAVRATVARQGPPHPLDRGPHQLSGSLR